MLADLAPGPFDSVRHIFEPKWDGVRCLAYLETCVLDGEVICGKGDKASFNLIQQRIHKQDAFQIKLAAHLYPASYWVFDILELGGTDITSSGKALKLKERAPLFAANFPLSSSARILRLVGRKGAILTDVFPELTPANFHLTPAIEAEGKAVFEAWTGNGYEGVMAKDLDGLYFQGKRSPAWQKIKLPRVGEFWGVALTPGEGARADTFGSLVLASLEGVTWIHRGEVGSGFSNASLKTILEQARDAPASLPLNIKGARWIEPVQVKVKYLDETEDGKLRHPVLVD